MAPLGAGTPPPVAVVLVVRLVTLVERLGLLVVLVLEVDGLLLVLLVLLVVVLLVDEVDGLDDVLLEVELVDAHSCGSVALRSFRPWPSRCLMAGSTLADRLV